MFKKHVFVMATVVLLHGLLFAAVWFARVELPRREESALVVTMLGAPVPAHEIKPPAPRPLRLTVPIPVALVDNARAIQIPVVDQVSETAPAVAIESAASAPVLAITQTLGPELAVQCPERMPPHYPAQAKRQREEGEVRLRVKLDENGRVASVTVVSSSGSPRLDEAARTAIESWRCRPAQRDGQPVRAVALQSLAFVLDRR
jgi:protein TonB